MENNQKNKWMKYQVMKTCEELKPYLPETLPFTKPNFYFFTHKYKQIILKPTNGMRGKGVYRVSRLNQDIYHIHYEKTKKIIVGTEQTYNYIYEQIKNIRYIIQQRVHLLQIDKQIFDIRIMVQRRTLSDKWTVTGKVAKIAGEGYIVTNNERSCGTVMYVERAIENSLRKHTLVEKLMSKLDKIALLTANILTKYFPNQKIYGLDIGIDQRGNVWIIECNLKPMFSHFKKLEDKTMFTRIIDYALPFTK